MAPTLGFLVLVAEQQVGPLKAGQACDQMCCLQAHRPGRGAGPARWAGPIRRMDE